MLDLLQRIALRIQPLRYVAGLLGLVCLAAVAVILLGAPAAGDHNRYLAPAIVGFIWCLSVYGFIDAFRSVPTRAGRDHGLFARLKRHLLRGWFWLLAALFLASTVAALFLTFKLGSVWLDKY